MCRTMKTEAARSPGRSPTRRISGSTPPAEAPTTMMSWPAIDPPPQGLELGQDFVGVEPEEAVLVRPDLVDVDVVEAGVGVLLDLGPVPLGVRSADHQLGHVLRTDQLSGLLEVGGKGQLLAELAGNGAVDPLAVGGLDSLLLVGAPTDVDLPEAGTVPAALLELLHHIRVRGDAHEAVADPPGDLRRLGPRRDRKSTRLNS